MLRSLLFLCICSSGAHAAGRYLLTDVCVFGGTSGGIVAAVAVKRSGRDVVLLEPGTHLGGMTSGGLGRTDTGAYPAAIGGLAAEFYVRAEGKYGAGSPTYGFEPKVASLVFQEMLSGAGVVPMLGQELTSVRKIGSHLVEISLQSGLVVRAEQFIDATYEGDLLAAAGASFRVGREAASEYGESLNGILQPSSGAGFGGLALDPYVEPGNAASGLLPGISAEPLGTVGAADASTQAYNFRVCLTQAANRIPVAAPPNYNPADYELEGRYVAAKLAEGGTVTLGDLTTGLLHNNALKNGKTDWNANNGMSSDWVGHSGEWVTASYARRREIAKEHENYWRGLWEFLRSDARIPANVKTEIATWGLPADEFTANQGWPTQVYVREARRLVGPTVLTQQHGLGSVVAPNPVALAVYSLDSHTCRRILVNGRPTHEGGFFVTPAKPWGIPLEALTAKPTEVDNLSATFALSATHAAFASARMEPVFMSTSHAVAVAACQALEMQQTLATISRETLRSSLEAQGQVLDWAGGFTAEGIVVEAEGPGAARTGSWSVGSNPGFHGTQYLTDGNSVKGSKTYRFAPRLPLAGDYRVSLWWINNPNRATNVPVTISHSSGNATLTVDMTLDPDNNATPGGWKVLGTYSFPAGAAEVLSLETTGTNGFVIADAVRFEPISLTIRPTVSLVSIDPTCREGVTGDTIRFAVRRTGPVSTSLTVPLTYSGTVTPGLDTSTLPTTVTLSAGSSQTILSASGTADSQLEGVDTLQVNISPQSTYDIQSGSGSLSLRVEDAPFDIWRKEKFTPSEIAASQSLPAIDADRDGLSNALEFHLGTNPTMANRTTESWLLSADGRQLHLRRLLRKISPTITVQTTENLAATAWQTVLATLVQTEEQDGYLLEKYELPVPVPAVGRKYYRFRLE